MINNGTIINGTFLGKNKEKKFKPWVFNPIMLIPTKIDKDKLNVKAIWLVTVKLYGIIPNILLNSKNKCKENIKGK